MAEADLERLPPPLGAERHVRPAGDGVADVEVQAELPLSVASGPVAGGRFGTERGVDRVDEEEVRGAGPGGEARVPERAAGEPPAHAGHRGRVAHRPSEPRLEAARERLPEGEAVRIVEHPPERGRIRRIVGDRDGGTVRGARAPRGAHVAHEQGPAAVVAEHAGARVGVPEVEEAGDLPARVVRVAVELRAVGEQVPEVAEELQVVVDLRGSPDLGRVGHRGVAGRDERRRVAPLGAAAGGAGAAVFDAEVGEPGPAERQAGVAGEGVPAAVAGGAGPGAQLDAAAGPVVPEQEVEHAGDGVRAVLRRRAVPQHFDLPQRDRRNRGEVRSLGALLHAVGVVPDDDRPPVAPLAVDQHQRMVRGQPAQVRRPHDGGGVAVLLRVDVEGGQDRPQPVGEVAAALPRDVGGRDGVDRRRRLGHRPGARAAADHHDLVGERRRRRLRRRIPPILAWPLPAPGRPRRAFVLRRRGQAGKRGQQRRRQGQKRSPDPALDHESSMARTQSTPFLPDRGAPPAPAQSEV